jgi:hypothetical protein
MYLSSVQSLTRYYPLSLPKQIEQSFFTDAAVAIAMIAVVALAAIAAMVAIVMMSITPSYTPKFTLKRDSEGYYTLPRFEVPGFINKSDHHKSKEFNIRAGDFVLDTANGILPSGWAIEK